MGVLSACLHICMVNISSKSNAEWVVLQSKSLYAHIECCCAVMGEKEQYSILDCVVNVCVCVCVCVCMCGQLMGLVFCTYFSGEGIVVVYTAPNPFLRNKIF